MKPVPYLTHCLGVSWQPWWHAYVFDVTNWEKHERRRRAESNKRDWVCEDDDTKLSEISDGLEFLQE
jgi:hypothetical protein